MKGLAYTRTNIVAFMSFNTKDLEVARDTSSQYGDNFFAKVLKSDK